MKKSESATFTAKQGAERASVSIGTFRLWAWKLDAVPVYLPREYSSGKGRRVGAMATYTAEQVERIKTAIARRKANRT